MNRMRDIAMRIWLGAAVLLLTVSSAFALLDALTASTGTLATRLRGGALCIALIATNSYIAKTVFRRSPWRTVRRSLVCFGIWLALFAWYGWLREGAPYWVHEELLFPDVIALDRVRIWMRVTFVLGGFSMFPLLCWLGVKRGNMPAEPTGGP